jgi:hypothetical protein
MSIKPPPPRRKFAGPWDEIRYLYDKLLYWLYQREAAGKARPYAERLERLLARADPDQQAILGAECRSLIYETKGDYPNAIRQREREIRLIRRLQELARNDPNETFILNGYGYSDLSDRLDLLATLYHGSGKLDDAIGTLTQSRQLCKTHGVKFDGNDLLREYLREKKRQVDGKLLEKRRKLKQKPASEGRTEMVSTEPSGERS